MPIRPQTVVTAALLLFAACDYVDQPRQGGGGGPGPTPGETSRRILLEDMTGHTCNNCPSATQTALQLQAVYGAENVILVGVHCTDAFAAPYPPIGDGVLDTDFRTPAGNAYATSFNITFLPTGMVSRKPYNSSLTLSQSAWGSAIAEIIDDDPVMDIWFGSLTYNSTTNVVNTTVKVAMLEDIVGDHNLVIYLTEDNVIDYQIDNQATPPIVPDYNHRHVLRDNLNGTWGTLAISGGASVGDTLSFPFTYPLASNVIEPANCHLVAYVYRNADYEVLQAAEKKLP
ncbi:MAG: Omp28 family outer membrane lipoprotein [Flavobacteriales bacterium]|nr:Omp28 family outer membrane lipoprotein [Flavobacteriales bacterium]